MGIGDDVVYTAKLISSANKLTLEDSARVTPDNCGHLHRQERAVDQVLSPVEHQRVQGMYQTLYH